MPLECDPCICRSDKIRDTESFRDAVLNLLCQLLSGLQSQTHYDWEVLCDPVTGGPIFIRNEYTTDGAIAAKVAVLPDGSAFGGTIASLVDCDFEVEEKQFCDNGVDKTRLTLYRSGVAQSVTWLDVLGAATTTPVDINLVTAGSCQLQIQDTEVIKLCDNNAGILTPFLRLILTDSAGVRTLVDLNFQATGLYTVTGTVQECNPSGLFTYTESQVALADVTSTQVFAANFVRRERSWVQNNTATEIWLSHTGIAVLNQGIKLNINQIYEFSTVQSLHAIQDSGVGVDLDVVEST